MYILPSSLLLKKDLVTLNFTTVQQSIQLGNSRWKEVSMEFPCVENVVLDDAPKVAFCQLAFICFKI